MIETPAADPASAPLVAAAEALLPKYDVAVSRYTSYPTAPEWRDDFGADDWAEVLEESNDRARPLSIHVHLPFCRRLCLFCGCNAVVPRGSDPRPRYLEHVEREIEAVAERIDPGRRVVQIHLGGGTPTFFSPHDLERLFGEIAEHFRVDDASEIGVELDPRVTSGETLRRLRGLGCNRVSLGVPDFDPDVQRAIGRPPRAAREGTLARNFQGYTTRADVDVLGFGRARSACPSSRTRRTRVRSKTDGTRSIARDSPRRGGSG